MTSRQLARELEISERTARRDLATLRASGYPLTSVGARWHFVEGQGLPTPLASDGAGDERSRDRILRLDRAIHARNPIEMGYWSPGPGGELRLALAPLALRFIDGSLFLAARELPEGRWRALAVERMTKVRRQRSRFPSRLAQGLETYLEDRFRRDADRELFRALIRLEAPSAWRVKDRVWHPSQRVHPQADGAVVVSLRVPGFAWIKAWVLGFGAEAMVLSPPELIRDLCLELVDARNRYCVTEGRLAQLDLFEAYT